MIEFLKSSIEFQQWGWNISTVGAVGAIVLTLFQGWGFWKQSRAIWTEKSGQSISVPMTGFWLVYFGAFLVYALSVPSVVMVWNCFLVIPIAVATAGLWVYKERRLGEWGMVLLCAGFIPAMIYLPKDIVLMALYVPAYGVLVHQGYEVWKKGVGVLEPAFVTVFVATCLFWMMFTATTGQWVIFVFNCLAAPIWLYIFWRWYKTRVR